MKSAITCIGRMLTIGRRGSISAFAAAWRRCWATTAAKSSCSTACCSRCPARRSSTTATRSAWATTFYLGDRNGVRTPMQWSSDRNGGFSRANPQRLYLPLVVDPEYMYEALNVETQRNNPQSLWWWMKRLIALRHKYPAFGRGDLEILTPDNLKVLAFLRKRRRRQACWSWPTCRASGNSWSSICRPSKAIGRSSFSVKPSFRRSARLPYMLTLGPHAFYWFVLRPPTRKPRSAMHWPRHSQPCLERARIVGRSLQEPAPRTIWSSCSPVG